MRSLTLLLAVVSFAPLLAETPKLVITRRIDTTEDELRQQLADVKQVGYSQQSLATLYKKVPSNRPTKDNVGVEPPPADVGVTHFVALNREEAATLPWKTGADTTRGKEHALKLNDLSAQLRTHLRDATAATRGGASLFNAVALRRTLNARPEWQKVEAIPTLMQMLQAEDVKVREILIDTLAEIEDPEATRALAQRAIFDLAPTVRRQALQALALRPDTEYRQVLINGLRYPWPAVNDHAAEAIIALQRTDYVGQLVYLLREPDPRRPVLKAKDAKETHVRELVRVNHLSNCMLCHAVSASKDDLMRGLIPDPSQRLAPVYYADEFGPFVRADTTYLRQDFSVFQPVKEADKWPQQQRFDYLVRTRPATEAEVRQATEGNMAGLYSPKYPEHGALLFALRTLTKKNLGTTFDHWAEFAEK